LLVSHMGPSTFRSVPTATAIRPRRKARLTNEGAEKVFGTKARPTPDVSSSPSPAPAFIEAEPAPGHRAPHAAPFRNSRDEVSGPRIARMIAHCRCRYCASAADAVRARAWPA
jgi:hypothetical protein